MKESRIATLARSEPESMKGLDCVHLTPSSSQWLAKIRWMPSEWFEKK